MVRPYLGAGAQEISARVEAAAALAAGGPVIVHIGEEAHGFRNVGVELPRRRRSAEETRRLRRRVHEALEKVHIVLAQNALAPKVEGDLRGSVQVRMEQVRVGDAAHLGQPPRR